MNEGLFEWEYIPCEDGTVFKVIRNPNFTEEGINDSFAFLASISEHGNHPSVMHRGKWGGNIKSKDACSVSVPTFDTEEDITKFVEVMLELDWDSSTWNRVLEECVRPDHIAYTLFMSVSKERIKELLLTRL